ncbi:MAG: thioredoxin family protein [Candidatus Hydrogenedentes bacterium]|nr:thioredoxin family protein [Candidatus Hydrogenedentota bacterium]
MASRASTRVLPLFAFLALLSLGAKAAEGIPWSTDYAASIEKAKAEGKPILIDFTAEWCGWCKRLDEEVYADASTVNALKDFVCVKVDVDKQQNVALAYNVQSMPRTIAINAHGEVVGDQTGYMPLGTFLEFIAGMENDLARETGGMRMLDVKAAAVPVEVEKPIITDETPDDQIVTLLGDQNPEVRSEALRVVNEKTGKLRILVTGLASDYLGVRITALEALRKAGAADLKFDPWGAKSDRDAALPAWTSWADANTPKAEAATG